jgi:hypothetical protein
MTGEEISEEEEDTLILDITEEPEDEPQFPPETPEETEETEEATEEAETPPGESEAGPDTALDEESPTTEEETASPQAAAATEQPLPFDIPEGLPEIEPSKAIDPFAVQQKTTTGRGRGRLLWGVGSLLLILLLGGQTAWYQRESLMQHPQGKMLLEIACQIADCRLPQSRDPKLIKILNREIISHPTEEGALMLRLVLANQAAFDQPYPLIELSLYNTEEKLVARRNFRPREYLAADRDSTHLMPAGASEYIEMALEDPGSSVTGFRFDFF